jgi:hypothetical protein
MPQGNNPWSCVNVAALNGFVRAEAQSGELAAVRAAIERSGKSIPELAQEEMDWLQKLREKSSEAAAK